MAKKLTPRDKPYVPPIERKLTNKQLNTKVHIMGKSIRELTTEQLRVALYETIKEMEMVEKGIQKAYEALTNVMP